MVQVIAKSRAHAENQDNDSNRRGSVGIGVEEGAEVHCRTCVVQLLLLGLCQFGDRVEDTVLIGVNARQVDFAPVHRALEVQRFGVVRDDHVLFGDYIVRRGVHPVVALSPHLHEIDAC